MNAGLIKNGDEIEENDDSNDEEDQGENEPHHMNANVLQMAMINKMLPKGFKFEIYDVVKRQTDIHQKKTSGLANYIVKKPEIQNEKKQQKII